MVYRFRLLFPRGVFVEDPATCFHGALCGGVQHVSRSPVAPALVVRFRSCFGKTVALILLCLIQDAPHVQTVRKRYKMVTPNSIIP
jgi:hypothetical protein